MTPDTVLANLLSEVPEVQDVELAKAVAAIGKMVGGFMFELLCLCVQIVSGVVLVIYGLCLDYMF